MKESGEEFWVVVDVLSGLLHSCMKFGVVFRNEVNKYNILHVLPTLFDGVQLRRVGRKVFKDKPIGMFTFEEILRGDVGREPIPNDDRLFVNMTMQLRQPENKILGDARAVHDREVLLVRSTEMKFHFATGSRCTDETKAGLIASRKRFTQNRRLADCLSERSSQERHSSCVANIVRRDSTPASTAESIPRQTHRDVRVRRNFARRCGPGVDPKR